MRSNYVKTENVTRFLGAFSNLEDRGASEACLMILDGEPGLGKSAFVSWWASQTGSVYLRSKKEWTPQWMMEELLQSIGVKNPAHAFKRKFSQAIEQLSHMAIQAERESSQFAIVIDECDHIASSGRMLETLRDISDLTEVPMIFVGMGKVRANFARFPQVARRISQHVEFARASERDIKALADGLCEVAIAPDLLDLLLNRSGGFFSEIVEGLSQIERFAQLNRVEATLEALQGQTLFNDRRTNKPIQVSI